MSCSTAKPPDEDPVAKGLKRFADKIAKARAEKVTGSVTLEVYICNGTPNGVPKVIVSEGVK